MALPWKNHPLPSTSPPSLFLSLSLSLHRFLSRSPASRAIFFFLSPPLPRSLYTLYKFQPEYFLFTCTCYWTRELPITADNCVTFRHANSPSPSFFLSIPARPEALHPPPFARPFLPLIFLISYDIGAHKLLPGFRYSVSFQPQPSSSFSSFSSSPPFSIFHPPPTS